MSRAVLPGNEWKILRPQAVRTDGLQLAPTPTLAKPASIILEPVGHSPSLPRPPPVSL